MFKVLDERCTPTKGSKHSACVDLYAREKVIIKRGETALVPLGVKIDISAITFYDRSEDFLSSHYLQLMLRSSLGKKGLILPNGVGVIDLDYKDEIKLIVHNPICNGLNMRFRSKKGRDGVEDAIIFRGEEYFINEGDKIAQVTLIEHKAYLFGIKTDKEREGGFGSTGA